MKISTLTGFFWMLLALSAPAQTALPPGLLLDDTAYARVPYPEILTKEPLPGRASLEAYCPPVQAQGAYGTCVGFACGYYLRTIWEARNRGVTSPTALSRLTFSPSYVYEKAKSTRDYACTEGAYLHRVFAVLRDVGAAPFHRFPYPACGQSTASADADAARYRIRAYERLFRVDDAPAQKIYGLRKALAKGSPVVVGLVVPASFQTTGKRWQPAPGEHPRDPHLRGHALCVIGYDDRRYGGAFRVVNSFGKSWGDGGFCWIRYADLARFTRYGYRISAADSAPVGTAHR
jgi:hypothetical protein